MTPDMHFNVTFIDNFESPVLTFGPLDGCWQHNHAGKTWSKNLAKNDLGLCLVNT